MSADSVWGIVVAGGTGSRFGSLKQLESLGDRRVIDWSIAGLAPVCDGVVVVAPPTLIADGARSLDLDSTTAIVAGGDSRSDSVRAGLDALPAEATHVLVHDGARPLASVELARRVVDALAGGAAGVVPVIPVADSLRTIDGDPIDRSQYVAVQTPQGFDLDVLRRAHGSGQVATDDATLLHRIGVPVVHVAGEATNLKITERHDLAVAATLLAARSDQPAEEEVHG